MLLLGMMSNITKGDVLRYMLTPQVMPRLNDFYRSGFSNLAYMIALVYRGVNILPRNHPILSRAERSNLSLRGVMAAAGSELKFDRHHIDQVVIYFAIIVGLMLLCAQFFLALGYFLVNPALAQGMPTTYAGFFSTPNYTTDVAYMLLFSVFGVPELFNPGATQSEFHVAMQSLFQFYSIGLLVIAVIITCYYIFAILAETAETGVPFGKRYNHVWAPIRFVFALGLLIPAGYGLNSAQWISLYAAKLGSDFATRGWVLFNQTMTDSYLNDPLQRVGTPQSPDLTKLASYMMTVSACKHAYELMLGTSDGQGSGASRIPKKIEAYLVKSAATMAVPTTLADIQTFKAARTYFGGGDMLIRFGEHDASVHTKNRGNVFPYCGDIVIHTADISEPGSESIQEFYIKLVHDMFYASIQKQEAEKFVLKYNQNPAIKDTSVILPDEHFKATLTETLKKDLDEAIKVAVFTQAKSDTWKQNAKDIADLGWGGAGIWYNKIAQINGSLVTAVGNIPQPRMMPAVMEYAKRKHIQQDNETTEPYKPSLADNAPIQFNTTADTQIANLLSIVHDYWNKEDINQSTAGNKSKVTNNIFIDTVNMIFGTQGLFNMCANADVHPLVQLSMLGKGLIESTIRNLGLALAAGGVAALQIPFLGVAAKAGASIMLSVASITITMGFLLFYVLPFMPFLYFFFAVGGWVKGLFEAMIGVPLWALAHLRIDGEGLPGDAAINGYYLIFEIFLRPILIVFGLLASVIIFAALVKVLNEIWTLVVTNLSGHDQAFTTLCGKNVTNAPSTDAMAVFRGPIDELFFTVIYAIIVYMMGMSCFKLIDLVPNNILRYMGTSANTFNDAASDPAEGLMFRLSAGSTMVGSKLFGGGGIASQGGTAASKLVEGTRDLVTK